MQDRVELLRKYLRALAADAEGQLDSLRQQGCIPPEHYIDELALDLDAVPAGDMFAKHEIDLDTRESLRRLDQYLESISGQENAHLWTADALRSAVEWRLVREMAKDSLDRISN